MMRFITISSLLALSACGGAPFTIGETPDGGQALAELVPDVALAEDGGASDPPDTGTPDAPSVMGDERRDPDAGSEAVQDSSTVDASAQTEAGEVEASTTPEAATPEDAALEAEPLEAAAPEAAAPEAAAPEAGCGGLLYCQAPPSSTVCSDMHPTLSFSCSSGTCQPGDLCTFPVPNYPDYPECAGTVLCAE